MSVTRNDAFDNAFFSITKEPRTPPLLFDRVVLPPARSPSSRTIMPASNEAQGDAESGASGLWPSIPDLSRRAATGGKISRAQPADLPVQQPKIRVGDQHEHRQSIGLTIRSRSSAGRSRHQSRIVPGPHPLSAR